MRRTPLATSGRVMAFGGAGRPAANGNPVVDSADLVARALAVLDQDKMSADARPAEWANIASELATRPVGLEPTPAADLALQRHVLSDGAECFLPIRYFDVQCLVATFLVAPDRASELLVGAGLQPVLQEDGRAVVDLYCIEYRKTDIGPYNEVGLTVRAKAPGDPIASELCGEPSGHHRSRESSRSGDLGLQQVRRRH